MAQPTVLVKNLKKYFSAKGGPVKAVDGVNLEVYPGEIFGFLGPNGAGKTTTLRMLTTLIPPDSGEAIVAGFDVRKSQDEVRRHIGYVSQLGGSDRPATGTENLILQGQLYGMSAAEAKARAKELIKLLDLSEFADRIVYTFSGGQRRRLDVALGLMNRPKVLFLDEPTTGLDPQNRTNLWDQIKKLKNQGATIFMTTHYLEEADVLSDRLAIIDYGKIVAEGTPETLKKEMAFDCITLGIADHEKNAPKLIEFFKKEKFIREVTGDDGHLRLCVQDGPTAMPQILRLLDNQKIQMLTISMSRPTLDDVFLKKTGHSLRDTEANVGGQG
ncbi:MAG: ATP-binding cassette domain-containing protein [Patescibacteria group bacterium]|jgi:ABC-2 type transport system ATP-binding protein